MGLDMYLTKMPKVPGYTFEQLLELDERIEEFEALQAANPTKVIPVYEDLKPHISQRGSGVYKWNSLRRDVGYWRKANAIHRFFVEYVQGGEDECEPHQVEPIYLGQLLATCKKVLAARSEKVSDELLPSGQGFFFGGTDYDEYYYECVEETIDIINRISMEDFDNYYIVYTSSW